MSDNSIWSRQFWKDSAERVIGTFAQGWLGAMIGGNVFDFDTIGWKQSLGIAGTAAVVSLLKCVIAATINKSAPTDAVSPASLVKTP